MAQRYCTGLMFSMFDPAAQLGRNIAKLLFFQHKYGLRQSVAIGRKGFFAKSTVIRTLQVITCQTMPTTKLFMLQADTALQRFIFKGCAHATGFNFLMLIICIGCRKRQGFNASKGAV